MNTELNHAIVASGQEAQYDGKAKKLLSQKSILARILIKTVDEFHDMSPEEVIPLIEGNIRISSVPVDPGMTNGSVQENGQQIVGMNMADNSLDYIHLVDDHLLGTSDLKGGLHLFNIMVIGVTDKLPEHDKTYDLHRLLGTLFSTQLSADEKMDIIEHEFNIPFGEDNRKELTAMCNLSQGIKKKSMGGGQNRRQNHRLLLRHEPYCLANRRKTSYDRGRSAGGHRRDIKEINMVSRFQSLESTDF